MPEPIVISVIVPAYNEAATIIELLTRVSAQNIEGFRLEVIVVDDGSSDETPTLLRANPQLYNELVVLGRNQGKGAAVKAGLSVARGDYILFQDADLEYDPADYARLLEPIRRFDADIVIGSRLSAPPITRVHYFWHKVGNRFITLLFNLFNNTTFTDIYTCYLLYRRRLLDPNELTTFGWEQQAEILALIVRRAEALFEVPISYYGRTYAKGKKIRAFHALGIIATILRVRLSRAPGRS